MDVPIDLSRALLVCTANNLETIPIPLLDRVNVLEVSGYAAEGKAAIPLRYLRPQARKASGLGAAPPNNPAILFSPTFIATHDSQKTITMYERNSDWTKGPQTVSSPVPVYASILDVYASVRLGVDGKVVCVSRV